MDFFKSVFSDDPDPPRSESNNASQTEHRSDAPDDAAWNFGFFIKTLTEKSESIIDIYRRDLQEFGTGLKKEIEVAQGSLESVGHVIDQFGNTVIKGTAQIISQGKDAILDSDSKMKKQGSLNSSKRYSRFEAQVRAIQGDSSTYTESPEDLERYEKWKSEFSLEGKGEEMLGFLRENDEMESVYKKIVPNCVDDETFWLRYYYKVYKLKKAEDVRARLVGRMTKEEEEEELSWDVGDDDEEEEEPKVDQKNGELGTDSEKKMIVEEEVEWDEIEDLSSIDEKKGRSSGSPSNVDLRKRLSAAAEEDLSWDIEDDDEHAKA